MQFVKLASSYYLDPAVLTLSETAEIAFVRSLAYAGGAESSGFIPEAALPMLMRSWTPTRGRKLAGELITAQLWVEVPGGWLLRSWHKHQDRMESGLAERRRKDAERQRKHRAEKQDESDGPSRDMSRDGKRDSSREESREPSRASAGTRPGDVELDLEEEPNPLLADLCRRLFGDTRKTTTTRELAYWEKLAGGADLGEEIEAFLVQNMGVVLGDPVSAWHGWLKHAAVLAAAVDPRPPSCDRCHGTGWDGEDDEGRPRRCRCRTVTPITSAPSAGVA
jgi:hypothetical protein